MATLSRYLIAAASFAALSGCAAYPVSTDDPYPVYGNPVNPTPAPGYRVECRTVPGIAYPLFNDFYSGCRQIIGPDGRVIVTKG